MVNKYDYKYIPDIMIDICDELDIYFIFHLSTINHLINKCIFYKQEPKNK